MVCMKSLKDLKPGDDAIMYEPYSQNQRIRVRKVTKVGRTNIYIEGAAYDLETGGPKDRSYGRLMTPEQYNHTLVVEAARKELLELGVQVAWPSQKINGEQLIAIAAAVKTILTGSVPA